MQTAILDKYKNTAAGQEAESILRKCVHCGFCTATCPTYQLLGDELDGPRGRIYQIKQVLEGQSDGVAARVHLDRCLTCRSCETTCPSGVEYGRLVDIGRKIVEPVAPRPWRERLIRTGLGYFLSSRNRAGILFAMARWFRPILPVSLANKVPPRQKPIAFSKSSHPRKMLLLEGCVQPALTPATNQAARQVLDRLGITLESIKAAGCCGALNHHLSQEEQARAHVRRNIDAWWPRINNDVEAIVVSATGCGVMIKDYGYFMQDDQDYAAKAEKVSSSCRDLSEVVIENFDPEKFPTSTRRIAFHTPCTYQHGLRLNGKVEEILTLLGYELNVVRDSHMCCGSAGTYSILQSELSSKLLDKKIENLLAGAPELIVTANVGCQTHLMSAAEIPVQHWIELLAE
ncbi:MAG: glycolate oxidase iron-sulfur subunit [Parasphingorhabdus sp.]